jgi:hypothetical protein
MIKTENIIGMLDEISWASPNSDIPFMRRIIPPIIHTKAAKYLSVF